MDKILRNVNTTDKIITDSCVAITMSKFIAYCKNPEKLTKDDVEDELMFHDKKIVDIINQMNNIIFKIKNEIAPKRIRNKLIELSLFDDNDLKNNIEVLRDFQNDVHGQKYRKLQDLKNYYVKLNDKLIINYNAKSVGELLYKSLNNEIKLYLTPTILNELYYESENDNLYKSEYKEVSLENLLKNFYVIQYDNGKYFDMCKEVFSRLYRADYRNANFENILDYGSPMKNDRNAFGIFADSLIMAEASLSGLDLITFNSKDFIGDKKYKIRDHINFVHGNYQMLVKPVIEEQLTEIKSSVYKTKPQRHININKEHREIEVDNNVAKVRGVKKIPTLKTDMSVYEYYKNKKPMLKNTNNVYILKDKKIVQKTKVNKSLIETEFYVANLKEYLNSKSANQIKKDELKEKMYTPNRVRIYSVKQYLNNLKEKEINNYMGK